MSKYEASDQVDNRDLGFAPEESYEGKTIWQIKTAHQKLIEARHSTAKPKLSIFAQRGKMYHFFKQEERCRR